MEFINYLVENYMWLLIITGILIITIIGFIADNRSEKAKKKKLESQPIIKPEKHEEVKNTNVEGVNIVSEPVVEEKNLIEPKEEVVNNDIPMVNVPEMNTVQADNLNTVQEEVIPVNTVMEEEMPINIPFREDNITMVSDVKPEVLDFDQMTNMVQEKKDEVISSPVMDIPHVEEAPVEVTIDTDNNILDEPRDEALNSWDQFDNPSDPLGSTVNMTDFLSQIETPEVMSHQNGEEVKKSPSNEEGDLWKL